MGPVYPFNRKTMTQKQDKKNTKDNQCDINSGNKQVDTGIGFQGNWFSIDVCARLQLTPLCKDTCFVFKGGPGFLTATLIREAV